MKKMKSKPLKIRVIYDAEYHDSNIDNVLSTKKAFLQRMDEIKQIKKIQSRKYKILYSSRQIHCGDSFVLDS